MDISEMYSQHNNSTIHFPILSFQVETGLSKNMAQTSGSLKWAKMLRERIQTSWEKIKLLFEMSV